MIQTWAGSVQTDNIGALLSNIVLANLPELLNNAPHYGHIGGMKRLLPLAALIGAVTIGSAAQAACVVEYKAKRDNPTEYRHATISIPDDKCSPAAAQAYVREALAANGWTLLAIVNVGG